MNQTSKSQMKTVSRMRKLKDYLTAFLHKKLTKVIGIQMLFLVIFIATGNLRFATNDDTVMVALAAGAYGEPSLYLLNMHFFIGCLTKFLFTFLPFVNWITIIFLASFIFSLVTIDYVLFNVIKTKNVIVSIVLIAFLLEIMLLVLGHFTFTVIAYFAAIAGSLLLLYCIKNKFSLKSKQTVVSYILFAIAIMIRTDVMYALAIMLIPVVIFQNWRNIKKACPYFVPVILLFVLLYTVNTLSFQLNSVQKTFRAWGEARSEALDTKALDFGTNEDAFAEMGWGADEYLGAYNTFYYNKEIYSTDNFKKMVSMNTFDKKYNLDVESIFKDFFRQFNLITNFNNIVYFVFLLLIIIGIITSINKKDVGEYLVLLAAILLANTVFLVINRAPYRVVMPCYIFGILIALVKLTERYNVYRESTVTAQQDNGVLNKNNIVSRIAVISLAVLLMFSLNGYFVQKTDMNGYYENGAVLSYMEANEDKLFLAASSAVLSVDVSRNVFDFAGRNKRWNLMGDWEIYSEDYYKLIKYYDVQHPDNLLLDMVDNPNILFIYVFGEDLPQYQLNLIRKSSGKDVRAEMVDIIATPSFGNFTVFKIVSV